MGETAFVLHGALVILLRSSHSRAASNAKRVARNGTGRVLAAIENLEKLICIQGWDDRCLIDSDCQFRDVIPYREDVKMGSFPRFSLTIPFKEMRL